MVDTDHGWLDTTISKVMGKITEAERQTALLAVLTHAITSLENEVCEINKNLLEITLPIKKNRIVKEEIMRKKEMEKCEEFLDSLDFENMDPAIDKIMNRIYWNIKSYIGYGSISADFDTIVGLCKKPIAEWETSDLMKLDGIGKITIKRFFEERENQK